MNIENNFINAKKSLDLACDKVSTHEYETALEALAIAYLHTRALLEQVFNLKALKIEVETTQGD